MTSVSRLKRINTHHKIRKCFSVMRLIPPLTAWLVVLFGATTLCAQDDFFINAALDPVLQRDAHGTGVGGDWIGSARTTDGQSTKMIQSQIVAASNLWNNERNQVLFGVQYGSVRFDRSISLPGDVTLPEHIERVSAGVVYKTITQGDWSIVQSVQISRTASGSLSGPSTNSVALAGLASISREPGYAWIYGYLWTQAGNSKFDAPIPLIEYSDASREDFTFIVGFPIIGVDYSPHPDWRLVLNWSVGSRPAAVASYKVTGRNYARIQYGDAGWAYRLGGHGQKDVAYTSQRIGIGWTYFPFFRRRSLISIDAFIGRELNRKLGDNEKLSIEDANIAGLHIGLGF